MNRELKNQNCLKIAKFLSSRLFRSCMVGIVIVCLVVIAVPDYSYGEETAPQDTDGTDSQTNADDMEDMDINDIDLEEIPEEEETQDVEEEETQEDVKEEDTEDLEEIDETEEENSQQEEKKETASDSESKKTISTPKVTRTKAVSSSKKKRLDPIPQTGKNEVKAIAGLTGTIALGFYLFSKKLKRKLYRKQYIKTRRFLS